MLNFKVPLNDMRFVMNEVFDYPAHYRNLGGEEQATPELVDAIMEAAATYSEEVLAPLYISGDAELMSRFLEMTGLDPSRLRAAAALRLRISVGFS